MDWPKAFKRFLDYLNDATSLRDLSMTAIKQMPPLEKLVKNHYSGKDSDAKVQSILERAARDAQLANGEIKKGFPLLHAHTLVGVWGALECAMFDFVVSWLTEHPKALEAKAFAKTKVTLSEFELLSKRERIRFLVAEYERSQRSHDKAGIDRFEVLFDAIGLPTKPRPENESHRTLHEMFHIRNLIVHRGSLADQRFVKACPYLSCSVGKVVVVSSEDWDRYREAVIDYFATVLARLELHVKEQKRTAERHIAENANR